MQTFVPQGPLLNFTAAITAPTSVQAVSIAGVACTDYVLSNLSATIGVVVGFGNSDTIAKANAAAGASVSNCVFLAPLAQINISAATNAYFSGISTSSTAVVYVQSGAVK
jgi:hypothetical protein